MSPSDLPSTPKTESAVLNFKEAAAHLKVSVRWLQEFLSVTPADARGVPFYTPLGRRKKFTIEDLNRILAFNRDEERERLVRFRRFDPQWSRNTRTEKETWNRANELLGGKLGPWKRNRR